MEYHVMLVEGNRLMLEQLAHAIKEAPGFTLAARYQDPMDALGQGVVFHPNLILLDIDQQSGTGILADFLRVFPNTAIICMGERWQSEVASHVVQSGARGYLVKPFSAEELREAVDTFGKSGMEVSSHTMAFFSPKGKSGKTTLIANLAMSLAQKTGEPVGIIDADLQFGDMSVFFNLDAKSTIVEASRDVDFLSPISLNNYFLPVTDKVKVLCGTQNPSLNDKVEIEPFVNVLNMSKNLFRYVLVDIPAGFNPTSIAACEATDTTYLVAMINGGYEIRHMQRALEIFKDWENYTERVKTIYTRVTPCDIAAKLQIEELMGYPVEAIIPNEYLVVSEAADNGRMATDIQPDSQLSRSINKLADKIIGHKHIRWDKP